MRHHNESDPQFSFAASISPTLGAQSDDEVRPPKSVVIYRCKHLGCISTFPSTSQLREHALKCSAAAVSFEFDFMLDKLRSFVTQTEELVHSHPHVAELVRVHCIFIGHFFCSFVFCLSIRSVIELRWMMCVCFSRQ